MGTPHRIVVILGPTAGGKTDLAVAIARRFGGEILSADSMQVYRRLDAGTAKPPAEQRAAAPHHLIDIVEPTDRFTVADWLARAESLIGELHGRGRLPIVVGGTNLYVKALLEGMFEGPPADEQFRKSLAAVPVHELHVRLAAVDPLAANRIDRNDRKRITRALEVHKATGKPISALQSQWDQAEPSSSVSPLRYLHNPILIGLRWSVEAINGRINARVKQMFHSAHAREDLISETRRLDAAGLLGPQAREAIGTKQVLEQLVGKYDADEAMERVKIETRRFAKAQRTWLKRYRGVHWLDAKGLTPNALFEQAISILTNELGAPANSKCLQDNILEYLLDK